MKTFENMNKNTPTRKEIEINDLTDYIIMYFFNRGASVCKNDYDFIKSILKNL